VIGIVFACLVVACGVAINRGLRLPLSVAPLSGLAGIAVLTASCVALGAPPVVTSGVVAVLGLSGVGIAIATSSRLLREARSCRLPLLILAAAVALPALVLGSALAGVEAPVSTHDGAFHVETIDALRHGVYIPTWYPLGFHASVAAVLGLAPWLDTARGTPELAIGLAVLAPVAVFSLGLTLGLDVLVAAMAAAILSLTWTYPYDYHLWGGWPQGMGILLLLGLWIAALRWIQRPTPGWAVFGGVCAGAIVLSHGTEVYSGVLGLAVIAIARGRHIDVKRLAWQLPLALAVALLAAAPYLPTLFGWFSGGAATGAGEAIADYTAANPEDMGHGDWLQFVLGVTGAAAFIDLPVRVALIVLGVVSMRRGRLAIALWATILALLLIVDFVNLPPVRTVFITTYPWLVDHRPRQIAVVFASLLAAGGLATCVRYVAAWRPRLVHRPGVWRRVALACVLVAAFLAEGSGVSVYKRLTQTVGELGVYSADDGAAMAWLQRNARAGDVLVNDNASDAGIWAPYKADMPILLPRSGSGAQTEMRQGILEHVSDLNAAPTARAAACALHVGYVYSGARPLAFDEHQLPERATLELAPGLEEVFSSGDAAVFRIHLPCDS
jgi:hypothetical protein